MDCTSQGPLPLGLNLDKRMHYLLVTADQRAWRVQWVYSVSLRPFGPQCGSICFPLPKMTAVSIGYPLSCGCGSLLVAGSAPCSWPWRPWSSFPSLILPVPAHTSTSRSFIKLAPITLFRCTMLLWYTWGWQHLMILDKLLNFLKPQYFLIWNIDKNRYLVGQWWQLHYLIHIYLSTVFGAQTLKCFVVVAEIKGMDSLRNWKFHLDLDVPLFLTLHNALFTLMRKSYFEQLLD